MPVIESSIPAVLAQRARQQPDDIAYTFIDDEVDPAGFAESLTWSQVQQRALVAFLGAIQAGFIAVPLSVPQFGTHDERVSRSACAERYRQDEFLRLEVTA